MCVPVTKHAVDHASHFTSAKARASHYLAAAFSAGLFPLRSFALACTFLVYPSAKYPRREWTPSPLALFLCAARAGHLLPSPRTLPTLWSRRSETTTLKSSGPPPSSARHSSRWIRQAPAAADHDEQAHLARFSVRAPQRRRRPERAPQHAGERHFTVVHLPECNGHADLMWWY
ncbi:hypothetical protein B0H14DRAFT_3453011 [Mycena olivaceomarginata]|nr:hypothetical protein B0H14DRAFT_3453011 [Mycena olivaceomarginata]